jgi:hypothetical protein
MFDVLTQKEFEKAEKKGNWKDDYNPILEAQRQKMLKEFVEWLKEHQVIGLSGEYYHINPIQLAELKKLAEEK